MNGQRRDASQRADRAESIEMKVGSRRPGGQIAFRAGRSHEPQDARVPLRPLGARP
jgi:hypothetical protein